MTQKQLIKKILRIMHKYDRYKYGTVNYVRVNEMKEWIFLYYDFNSERR